MRGWPVAVIDNLSTGFRFAVPDGVPFYEGDIADAELLAQIFAEQGTRRDHAFRRLDHGARNWSKIRSSITTTTPPRAAP